MTPKNIMLRILPISGSESRTQTASPQPGRQGSITSASEQRCWPTQVRGGGVEPRHRGPEDHQPRVAGAARQGGGRWATREEVREPALRGESMNVDGSPQRGKRRRRKWYLHAWFACRGSKLSLVFLSYGLVKWVVEVNPNSERRKKSGEIR